MIEPYKKTIKLLPGLVNSAMKLDPTNALRLFQDMATEHSAIMGVDYYTLKSKSNAFWAITKTRLHFFREPAMLEELTLSTWPNSPSNAIGNRDYSLTDKNGSPAIIGMSEWVLLDCDTRRLRRFSSTCYPIHEEHPADTVFDTPFRRFNAPQSKPVYTHTVRASDTDLSHHTNNTVYCRMMLDCFPCDFFAENSITDFEIHYNKESVEGEKLSVCRSNDGNEFYLTVINSEGKEIATGILTIARK